ncbi:MAG: OmpH family outer membrane protein [Smithellaceae bacterium]|jgi:outer membrane protein
MKRNICLMGGIILLLFVWGTSSLAADKIGFINMREIMQNSTSGKKAGEDLKKVAEKKQALISSAEKELKKMKDELDKQGSILTASARRDKEDAYQKKLRDYQLLVNDANEELKKRDQEISLKLLPEIVKIVRSIAEKEKYTLVIDIASMPVPYFAKEDDFSKKVIEEYNKSK